MGVASGRTVLTMWFTDAADKTKDKILSFRLQVGP